jgi:raffinose/stachyose/melibiose transport system permease protein
MMKNLNMQKVRSDFLFIGPAFFVFAMIVLLSFSYGLYYSFTEWNGVDQNATWVGLDNYFHIFSGDEQAVQSAKFTGWFTLVSVTITNILAFFLALALTLPFKLLKTLKTIIFLPNVIGGIILGFVWRFIFTNTFGSLGDITGIGFFQFPWLGTPETGFWASVIVFVWQRTGYLMLIYIASILTIDEGLFESARIDGANAVQMLTRIIVPLTIPAFTICFFLSLSWTTKMFDVIFALTEGGPFGSTETFAMNIYYEAFRYNNYGIGSAKAIIFFVIVGLISTMQVLITKRWEVES